MTINETKARRDATTAQLQTGAFSFTYRKKDGSPRPARGTLMPSLMPGKEQEDYAKRTQNPARVWPDDVVVYFDLDAVGLRQFSVDAIIDPLYAITDYTAPPA